MKNRSDGEEIEAGEEERKKLGEGVAAASLGFSRGPSFFFVNVLFYFFVGFW
jgi:hypothetical protein